MSLLKGEGDVLAKGVKLLRRHELVQPPAPRKEEEEDGGGVTSRSISFQSCLGDGGVEKKRTRALAAVRPRVEGRSGRDKNLDEKVVEVEGEEGVRSTRGGGGGCKHKVALWVPCEEGVKEGAVDFTSPWRATTGAARASSPC